VKAIPSNYDYVMYVDASGDDGGKFDKGSSSCYAAAGLLVKREDIVYNLDILNQIKKTIGCKEKDEIKYARIRRHRYGDRALHLLSNIRGNLSCYIVFKKELTEETYLEDKTLSAVCHTMAVHSLHFQNIKPSSKVLIVIDHMKKIEEKSLVAMLDFVERHRRRNFNLAITFQNSKNANFLLIQIADLLCGAIREHFEQYETSSDMIYFSKTCPVCNGSVNGVCSQRPLCDNGKIRAANIISSGALKYVLSLFPITGSPFMATCCCMEPICMMDKHFYMLCDRKT